MYTRIFTPPENRSYFLLGPRGTGKTTWLKQQYPQAVFFDLLNPTTYLRFQRYPEAFRQEVEALKKDQIVVIDEVQKNPLLLDDVHHFLSQRKERKKFILSGSSARKLKRSSSNLLAGRASQRFFHPLVQAEHQHIENIDDILCFGTLPEVLNLKTQRDKIEFLESYTVMYLREEIQQEAVTKNIHSFSRFLDVAALCNAQVTHISSVSRDTGVARTTLKGYFQALEDTLVGYWLNSWKPKRRIKEVHLPKFFFFDTGITRALSGLLRQTLSFDQRGHLLETYIFHELRVWGQKHGWGSDIYFWKTHHLSEIDFLVEIHGKKVGIEVKASQRWKKEFGKHLKKAKEEKAIHRALGVYLGLQKLNLDNMEVYPLKDFLKILEKDKIL